MLILRTIHSDRGEVEEMFFSVCIVNTIRSRRVVEVGEIRKSVERSLSLRQFCVNCTGCFVVFQFLVPRHMKSCTRGVVREIFD